jgi:branched-chain amino acid transport system ATP-binding protein
MNLLDIRNLEAAYDGASVLHGVSLVVEEGAFVAVLGANTAGKSTLLRAISGLVPKVTGEVLYRGGNLPEGRHVFPAMAVEENLMLGGYNDRHDTAGLKIRLQQVFEMFPRLAERKKQLAGTLSGGEQQMVAIGRALMGAPALLLLDEPSHGLAPKIVQELHDALLAIHKTGVTMLLVEQNTKLALSVASHAFVLRSGQVVLSGKSDELLHDARIREAYLGI